MTALYTRAIAALLLVAALIFGWHELTDHYDQQGYARRAAEDKAAADKQAAANRDLQRAAELKYVVKRDAQEKVFVTVTKEIHDLAAPLATCAVPDAVRVRLRAAAACALGDSPAACGAPGEVPSP